MTTQPGYPWVSTVLGKPSTATLNRYTEQPLHSVRITSNKWYTGGLFLLDLTAAPWGCGTSFAAQLMCFRILNRFQGVWPAFWTFGQSAQWPAGGEIDIIEGVHDNIHNQVAWHTEPGCMYTPSGNYTGTPKVRGLLMKRLGAVLS